VVPPAPKLGEITTYGYKSKIKVLALNNKFNANIQPIPEEQKFPIKKTKYIN
jgi:hypothetical protein